MANSGFDSNGKVEHWMFLSDTVTLVNFKNHSLTDGIINTEMSFTGVSFWIWRHGLARDIVVLSDECPAWPAIAVKVKRLSLSDPIQPRSLP